MHGVDNASSLPPDGPHADAPEQDIDLTDGAQAPQQPETAITAHIATEMTAGVVTDAAAEAMAASAPAADTPDTASDTPRRQRHRALIATAIGASYVALAAGTAAAVVAVASPAPVNVAALASTSASPAATSPSSASASSTVRVSASPSPSPSPRSTVVGSVRDGVHRGDLRYFLLPPPETPGSVQGDPDGTREGLDDILKEYGGDSQVKSALEQLGFKTGATRTYQDSDLGANVSVELLQFDSGDNANSWLQGFQLNGSDWTSFSIPGEPGAMAREKHTDGLYSLIGVYTEGDTFYQVDVYGSQSLPQADLSNLMIGEYGRLSHG